MKKIYLTFLIFILAVPVAFADIILEPDQTVYNIGNKIKVSASVLHDKNFDGLFKMTLSCGNYKLQYFYSTPIYLEANFRTAVDMKDPIKATSSMLGNCTITGDLMTNDNLIIEEKGSNNFGVTSQLEVLPVNGRITALPNDSIQIAGVINEAFGNNALKAPTKITLDNNSYAVEALDGKFNITLEIAKNIKSGKHTIGISASDSKGNSGSASVELEITAIPSYIKTELGAGQLAPGSKIQIMPSLYDQADDLINDSLGLELTSPGGTKVFKKSAQSSDKIDYEFSQYAVPGLYVLSTSYKNLHAQNSINITIVREVKVKYENETVFIENIGNIPFEDRLTFIIQNELKKYPITKNINVDPGKILNIDLSREVPLGIYNVMLPIKEGIQSLKEKINETLSSLLPEKEDILAADVTIHDNRPVYKKIASGLSSVSGSLVGANGLLANNPLITPIILVVILSFLVFRYGRKPIMGIIRRRKSNEKEPEKKES